MLLELNSKNPSARKIQKVADTLDQGGVIIYPTDSVYGLGCDIFNQKAVARICQIRRIDPAKANLTFICKDIQQLSKYVFQIDNELFRLLKSNVPGAFTFIFKANKEVPRHFKNKRKTINLIILIGRLTLRKCRLNHLILQTSKNPTYYEFHRNQKQIISLL